MLDTKFAVGVGYEFIIVSGDLLCGIRLKNTHGLVAVNEEVYPLYKGETYDDSTKIDAIMDGPAHPQIYKIDKHLVQ